MPTRCSGGIQLSRNSIGLLTRVDSLLNTKPSTWELLCHAVHQVAAGASFEPEQLEASCALGLLYEGQGQPGLAMACHERCLQLSQELQRSEDAATAYSQLVQVGCLEFNVGWLVSLDVPARKCLSCCCSTFKLTVPWSHMAHNESLDGFVNSMTVIHYATCPRWHVINLRVCTYKDTDSSCPRPMSCVPASRQLASCGMD